MHMDLSTGKLKMSSWRGAKVIVSTKQTTILILWQKHRFWQVDILKTKKRKFWYPQTREWRWRGRYFPRKWPLKQLRWTKELPQRSLGRSTSIQRTICSRSAIVSSIEAVWRLTVSTLRGCSSDSLADKKIKLRTREGSRTTKISVSRICYRKRINKCVLHNLWLYITLAIN